MLFLRALAFLFLILFLFMHEDIASVFAGGVVPSYLVWSQDSTVVVWEAGGNIYASSADGGDFRVIAQDCSCFLIGIGVLPDHTKTVWYYEENFAQAYIDPNGMYAVNLDGSNRHEIDLAFNTAWFSPDGTQVVFDKDGEIYVTDAAGGNPINLTNHESEDYIFDKILRPFTIWQRYSTPQSVWSPDGTQIAFHSQRDGNQNVYAMDADGDNIRIISDLDGSHRFRGWSPDGSSIVFEATLDLDQRSLFIRNLETGIITKLSGDLDTALFEAWSPNSERLVFSGENRDASTGWGHYIVDTLGSNLQFIAGTPITSDYPFQGYHSPDIAWSSDSQSFFIEVGVVREDGTQSICTARANAAGNGLECVLDGWFDGLTPDGQYLVRHFRDWDRKNGIQLQLIDPSGDSEDIIIESPT